MQTLGRWYQAALALDTVVKLRQESERVAQNELSQGVLLVSERRRATAEGYKAQADRRPSPGHQTPGGWRTGHGFVPEGRRASGRPVPQ